MKSIILLVLLLPLGMCIAFSQGNMTVEEYIDTYKGLAMDEMKTYHIPASITLAQGILESNSGNSPLAKVANNHFGIKCHKEWTGKTFYQDDDEEHECFRKYDKAEESFRDHSEFLSTRDRYKSLFDLEISDYRGWAHGLKQAGYATNPRYPELLIKIIEENRLYIFDKGGDLIVSSRQPAVGSPKEESSQAPETYEIFGKSVNDRIIFLNNGVKFIIAREGDDLFLLASDFQIYTWQLYKYNDLGRNDEIKPGMKIYLEKKKAASDYKAHIAGEGETLQSVSQDYGIRLKSLCRMNGKQKGDTITKGEKLRLN